MEALVAYNTVYPMLLGLPVHITMSCVKFDMYSLQ